MNQTKNSHFSELAKGGIQNKPDRRQFLHRGIVATVTLTGSWLGVSGPAEIAEGSSPKPKRPNIVFIMADEHPLIVKRIARIMETAITPSERYPVGRIYEGGPAWKPL